MEQAILDWLNWLALRASPDTCAGYGWELRALVKRGGPMFASAWRTEDLTRYLAERRAAGVGAAGLKHCVGALRSFFGWACASASPAGGVPYPRVARRVQRTLSAAEALAVLTSCDTSTALGRRDVAIFGVMLDSGLRVGEVCRLRLADLDLDRRVFVVVVKGGQQRFGVFSEYTRSLLSAWLALRLGLVGSGVGTLFVSVRGRPLTRSGIMIVCRRAARRAGVAHFSPHALRRAFATLAIGFGAPTRVVQVAGRWSDVGQVERYSAALAPGAVDPYAPVARLMGER